MSTELSPTASVIKYSKASSLALSLGFVVGLVCAAGSGPALADNAPQATLSAFNSDEELLAYLKKFRRTPPPAPMAADGVANMTAAESPAPAPPAETTVSGESITNTQEANVDEGGIVKVHGDELVILRRGRLFTVSTSNGGLRPIDSIDAYPPGVNPNSDWYDEMLVAGDRVIVIGYSYGRGGTEINRFHIDDDGQLSYEDGYHLRSNDYYSSRNYASRLVGTDLIVYSPLYLPYGDVTLVDWLPALQQWRNQDEQSARTDFKRIVSARQIYMPAGQSDPEHSNIEALHTVTTCDLNAPTLNCSAMSVLGPAGRTFYVSGKAVYVWVSSWWNRSENGGSRSSYLYRLPLDGSAPSAIGVRGSPVDQFSFREDWNDGRLNVLVRSEGGGDAMWLPEFSNGAIALLQLPLSEFNDGSGEAEKSRYRKLPTPAEGYSLQNRFVGDYLLFGTGNTWGSPNDASSVLIAAKVEGDDVTTIPLKHGVDRIEAMGRDAVVVGGDSTNLYFSAIELTSGSQPTSGDRYTLEGASQGETRSHGFFFKPSRNADDDGATAGVLGLPVARAGRPGYSQLTQNSAAMIFLRRAERKFTPLGELAAHDETIVDDACKASCVDWYGNARPIFLRDRTFALMGYELVEGDIGSTSIHELRRITFAPPARAKLAQ